MALVCLFPPSCLPWPGVLSPLSACPAEDDWIQGWADYSELAGRGWWLVAGACPGSRPASPRSLGRRSLKVRHPLASRGRARWRAKQSTSKPRPRAKAKPHSAGSPLFRRRSGGSAENHVGGSKQTGRQPPPRQLLPQTPVITTTTANGRQQIEATGTQRRHVAPWSLLTHRSPRRALISEHPALHQWNTTLRDHVTH